jgi:predicted GTPase
VGAGVILLLLEACGSDSKLDRVNDAPTAIIDAPLEGEVFRVAVVGEFKRGKSTLINALLGQEILPADILPCSATLNRVTYALTPRVELVYKPDASGKRRIEQIAPEDLAQHVTKLNPLSEQRAANIEEAIVYHPVKYCRDKADIIDTPGLNDDEAMTRVTLEELPRVDAAIFVILAQSPFSGFEADFLNRLLTHDLARVIFVVNRIDEIRREPDRERIINVVRDRIVKALHARAADLHGAGTPEAQALIEKAGTPRVFGLSAAEALAPAGQSISRQRANPTPIEVQFTPPCSSATAP